MWGILDDSVLQETITRIIPTYVGNTFAMAYNLLTCSGSSLRMWGIPFKCSTDNPIIRIIPTYVGNTQNLHEGVSSDEDHPYVCGEYIPVVAAVVGVTGSSLRMWGIRCKNKHLNRFIRIIPTYVGNTITIFRWNNWCEDHPYVCGEYSSPVALVASSSGSSLRMWGIR